MSLIPISTRDQLQQPDITKLDVQSNDILVISTDSRYVKQAERMASGVSAKLKDQGKTGVLLLIVSEGVGIEHLDAEAMAKHGWYR
jgi:hypothetical protein